MSKRKTAASNVKQCPVSGQAVPRSHPFLGSLASYHSLYDWLRSHVHCRLMKPDVTELMLKNPLPFWVDPSEEFFFFSPGENKGPEKVWLPLTRLPHLSSRTDWIAFLKCWYQDMQLSVCPEGKKSKHWGIFLFKFLKNIEVKLKI